MVRLSTHTPRTHAHTHAPAHLICPLLYGRPQWGLCCFLSCQLSHGCQQLLLRIRYTHILPTHTNMHSLSAWNTGSKDLLFVPIFLLASHLDLHPLKQDKQSQMKNLSWMVSEREIKHTEKNKWWVSLVSSINTLLLVCTYTSDQMCTIIYCWVQSTVGRWRGGDSRVIWTWWGMRLEIKQKQWCLLLGTTSFYTWGQSCDLLWL